MNNVAKTTIPIEPILIADPNREPLIDLSDKQRQRRALTMVAPLDRMAAIQDGPDIDGAFFRALDELHPDRPN